MIGVSIVPCFRGTIDRTNDGNEEETEERKKQYLQCTTSSLILSPSPSPSSSFSLSLSFVLQLLCCWLPMKGTYRNWTTPERDISSSSIFLSLSSTSLYRCVHFTHLTATHTGCPVLQLSCPKCLCRLFVLCFVLCVRGQCTFFHRRKKKVLLPFQLFCCGD
mmetsp:Transcript_23120/g.23389  ORF Transcript_23120/g.23389 Transcript_23120/m.23389 type:complete len:162 (-) Transcript_23120:484-969(-)